MSEAMRAGKLAPAPSPIADDGDAVRFCSTCAFGAVCQEYGVDKIALNELHCLVEHVGPFRQGEHLFRFRLQRGFSGNLFGDLRGWRTPAHQALEFQPADTVETVDDRILDHPGRRTVGFGRRLGEAQIFAQCRQRLHGGRVDHSPDHSRRAANGRRSR